MITDWAKRALLNGLKQGLEAGDKLPQLQVYDENNIMMAVVELNTSFEVVNGLLVSDGVSSNTVLVGGVATKAKLLSGESLHYMTLKIGSDVILDSTRLFADGTLNINRVEIGIG